MAAVPDEENTLDEDSILVFLEAISPEEYVLKHEDNIWRRRAAEVPYAEELAIGGAGTVVDVGANIEIFKKGAAVVVCLPRSRPHGDFVVVHCELACKIPPGVSKDDAARIPIAYACAFAILRSLRNVPLPTVDLSLPMREPLPPPENILIIANKSVLPLLVINLLRYFTSSTIFVVYEPKTDTSPAVSVDAAMSAGAHFAQQPSSTDDLWEVARGLRTNLGHYGPSTEGNQFDLLLDLVPNAETPEAYWEQTCEQRRYYAQVDMAVYADFEEMFLDCGAMGDLGFLLGKGEIRPGELYV